MKRIIRSISATFKQGCFWLENEITEDQLK